LARGARRRAESLCGHLSCADSRIAPEYAFDSGRGDVFVCRSAGNYVTPDILASFEFAVDAVKTPLLMVLGHESCGAAKAAISAVVDKVSLPGHCLRWSPGSVAPSRPSPTGRRPARQRHARKRPP
jgi:carbonic anhydrase